MQSLAQELGSLRLNVGLQVVWEGGPESGFIDRHEEETTRNVETNSAIDVSVSLVGGSTGSVRAETGTRSNNSSEKIRKTEGSLPGRSCRW